VDGRAKPAKPGHDGFNFYRAIGTDMMHESLMLPRRYLGRLRRRIDIERIVNELRWSLDLPREWSGRLRRSLGLMAVPSHALNCAVAYNKYGGYCIPASTFRHRLSRKILAGQVWEQTTLEFMRAHCGEACRGRGPLSDRT